MDKSFRADVLQTGIILSVLVCHGSSGLLARRCQLTVCSAVPSVAVHKVFHWAGTGLLESRTGLFPPPCLQQVKRFFSSLWSAAGVRQTGAVAGMTLYHFVSYLLTRFCLLLGMICVILATWQTSSGPP